jgi:hypothetical protein
MRLFFAGTSLLALAFLVHVVFWRVFVPERQTRGLLLIFILTPAAVLAVSVSSSVLPIFTGLTVPEALRLALFYVSCSLVYICIYSAVEVSSPTLTIVSYIASGGSAGYTEQEISNLFLERDDVEIRISSLMTSRLIAIDEGRCRLMQKGRFIAMMFEFASIVFRLPLGG